MLLTGCQPYLRPGLTNGRLGLTNGRLGLTNGRFGLIPGRLGLIPGRLGRLGVIPGRLGRLGVIPGRLGLLELPGLADDLLELLLFLGLIEFRFLLLLRFGAAMASTLNRAKISSKLFISPPLEIIVK